ncbi:MAG: ABC transporter ATP-binding protein [Clostridia bacterium]|nr:ABC transporter ATP-binding protein [Clostridia bacterium]
MIKITNFSKSYAKSQVKAVNDLSLTVNAGEIFGFLGPNGAGKTTTIKAMTGILDFTDGKIEIDGHDIKTDGLNAKKKIGFVSDSGVIYDKLTGREYLDFLADIYGVDKETRKSRAEKMLADFSLTEAFDKPISSYSHGMKQKIAVIGALIHDPQVWILDEPMTGLDPQSAFRLKQMMKERCAQGKTVFFSTHVLEVAEKLCDRVGIIVKGELKLVGSVDEVLKLQGDESLEEVFLSTVNGGEGNE